MRDSDGGQAIGVIGSNRTTNEENYLLQKFARMVLGTNNIDHHRTADFPAFAARARGQSRNATASMRDVFNAPAILLIGNDPTEQHPLLAWQIRNNVRLHRREALRGELAADQAAPPGGAASCRFRRARKASLLRFLQATMPRRGRLPSAGDTSDALDAACATSCAASRIWSSSSARRFAALTLQRW